MKVLILLTFLCIIGLSFQGLLEAVETSYNKSPEEFLPNTLSEAYGSDSVSLNSDNIDDITDGDNSDNSNNYVPVMALDYNGYWNASFNDTDMEFTILTQSSGIAEFTTAKNYYLDIDDFIVFTFYDGEYTDQKYVVVNFIYNNQTDFNPANSTFKNENMTFFVYLFDKYSEYGQRMCKGSYQLSFIDNSTKQPYQKVNDDYTNMYAEFQLDSPDCNIAISSTVSPRSEIKKSELMGYTVTAVIICIVHLWSTIKMSKDIIQSEPEGARISLLTLGYFIGWDVFLCLFHLYNALTVNDYFHYFLAPAFFYFVLVSIFETRLILLVWKSKYYSQYQNLSQVRRGIIKFYLMFYAFLTGFLLLCYFFLPAAWLFYALCPFFVPQIIHNTIRGQRYKFNNSFVFLLGLLRVAFPLYTKGYANNIFRLTPDIDFVYIYSGAILVQVAILFLQSKLGSRFFVPACLLPPRYNYFVKINADLSTDEDTVENCPICMENLTQTPMNVKSPLINIKPSKKVRLMQTPCRHQFHEQCLRGWMDLKLECPSCRSKLPPLD